MEPLITPYLFYRLAAQLLALFVLYFALAWLLPIVGTTLMGGMLLWNNTSVLYCWLIQCACIAVTVELRDTLTQKAAYWFTRVPRRQLRRVVALANIPVLLLMPAMLWILVQTIPAFSVAVAIELLLLLVQVWCLCGAAVPMSAKRFYGYFFQQPLHLPENCKWQKQNTLAKEI